MGIKEDYCIKPIEYKQAMDLVIKNHYLHRKCPCSFAFSLVESASGLVKGVIVYGTPSSASLRKGIAGVDNKDNIIELTRLWIDSSVPKNGESFLIGNTIPLVDKEIIVSYADTSQNHIGIVYQATNWLYTGLSAKRSDLKTSSDSNHSQTLFDKYKSVEGVKKAFPDAVWVTRPRKHRYIYLNCDKRRKKQLMKELKYKIENYPKSITPPINGWGL